jgi:fatty-acyl-CoA synthase
VKRFDSTIPAGSSAADVGTLDRGLELAAESDGGLTFIDAQLNESFVSYKEMLERAERVAGALRERDCNPGDRLCLLGSTTPDLLATLFGSWRAGLVPTIAPLPRGSDLGPWFDALRERMRASGSRLLLAPEAFDHALRDKLPSAPIVAFERLRSAERIDTPAEAAPGDLAYLQFTSGSTGRSRAVALGHGQILWNVFGAVTDCLELTGEDVRVTWLPLYHDFGLVMLLSAVFTAAPLIVAPPEEFLRRPGSWMDACAHYGAAVTGGPNSAYGLATRDLELNPRELDLSSLRIVLNGSEPIDSATMRGFERAASRYGLPPNATCPSYGMAEVTLAVTAVRPDQPVRVLTVDSADLSDRRRARLVDAGTEGSRELVGCGTPDPASEVRILDDGGDELPPWRVGEIVVRGPSVMIGYDGDDAATAEVLRDGWLHTGDLGFVTDDGELVPCGRIKDMVIVGGRNLYPEEFELLSERVDGVRRGNTIAFSLPDTERMVLVAETKLDGDAAADLAARVLRSLRGQLESAPMDVVVVPAGTLPKTSSGKRQRAACRELFLADELPALAKARA